MVVLYQTISVDQQEEQNKSQFVCKNRSKMQKNTPQNNTADSYSYSGILIELEF